MASETNELTFVRCPTCRSLVPASASRCRICNATLEAGGDKTSASSSATAGGRVRQTTVTASADEVKNMVDGGTPVPPPASKAHNEQAAKHAKPANTALDTPDSSFDPLGAFLQDLDDDSLANTPPVPPVADTKPVQPKPTQARRPEGRNDDLFGDDENDEEDEEISLLSQTPKSLDDDDDDDFDLDIFDDPSFDELESSLGEGGVTLEKEAPSSPAAPVPPTSKPPVQARPAGSERQPPAGRQDPARGPESNKPAQTSREPQKQARPEQRSPIKPQPEQKRAPDQQRPRQEQQVAREERGVQEPPRKQPAPNQQRPAPMGMRPRSGAAPQGRQEVKPALPQEQAPVARQGFEKEAEQPHRGVHVPDVEPARQLPQTFREHAAPKRQEAPPVRPQQNIRQEPRPAPAVPPREQRSQPVHATQKAVARDDGGEIGDERQQGSGPRLNKVKPGRLFGWLVSFESPDGRAIELRAGRFFVTGTSIRGSDLILEDQSISTPHALMSINEKGFLLQDLMSERGTFVRSTGDAQYRREEGIINVQHGDWIRFGDVEFLVTIVPG